MKEIMIRITGARENNLKNISLEIPHNKLILLTGVSGSGKTSLAYDVIFREGQSRFLESLSTQTRQFLSRNNRPDVDEIKGLRPVISVDQNSRVANARSTVGTMSGIYDLLRLLFARLGEAKQDISPLKRERRLFSFNTDYGACPHCKGLGVEEVIDPNLIIKDPNLSLREGALVITQPSGYTVYSQVTIDVMDQVCRSEGFNVDIPWKDLTKEQKDIVWYGSDKIKIPFGKHSLESRMKWSGITAKPREEGYYKGIIPIMEEILKRDRNANILRFVKARECSSCQGKRLNKAALSIHFAGRDIAAFHEMSLREIHNFFQDRHDARPVFESVKNELLETTGVLLQLGLGHLQLNRESGTLSGGESRRIRLANQVQNRMSGLLYVFDEPSIGMHSRDQQALLGIMRRLVNQGNTVIVIEHESDFIRAVDWIIDIGPKAGTEGGEVLFNGPANRFIRDTIRGSLTKQYFLQEQHNEATSTRQSAESKGSLSIHGADIHNLQKVDADFWAGALNVVCGVSGSGKSSLVMQCLAGDFQKKQKQYISSGAELFQQLIAIDQSPIGRTPRSNPATYTKLFDHIRKLFSNLPEARAKAFPKNYFSFNVKGGRCEACQGAGYRQIGMHFIGNVEIRCEHCQGKRFKDEILEVKFQGKSIYDVLEMRVDEALDFFREQKDVSRILSAMQDLGLGYLQLGQRATTLSGGEAQRIKLAAEMSRKTKGKTLYILDEPTTGLHAYDVAILMRSLDALRKQGHGIIVIEHHHELIRRADRIIELGPESGNAGGKIVFQGSYADFIKQNSLTARALKGEFQTQPDTQKSGHAEAGFIELKGVRTHNLQNIDLKIPKGKMTVISGVSGSGKSSLAFDTLAAEGKMQFLQSLPNYIRGRLNTNSAAEFDQIKGLTPVIAVRESSGKASPRSTLGTYSDIYDLFRLLYSRIGRKPDGTNCGLPASAFSFNNQDAACPECGGLGEITTTDPDKLISHPEHSILSGAMQGSKTGKFYGDPNGQYVWTLRALDRKLGLNLENPWQDLSADAREKVLYGAPGIKLDVAWQFTRKGRSGSHHFETEWQGLVALVDEEYRRKHADKRGEQMRPLMKDIACPVCEGKRLKKTALDVQVAGLNIAQLSALSVKQCLQTTSEWAHLLAEDDLTIIRDLEKELNARLQALINMELGYLQIDRKLSSLSGGELQRLQIARHIYGAMSGITYIMDEPAKGLHPKNVHKLLQELQKLLNQGNSLVLVEHNEELIQAADHLVIMGPKAGKEGGQIVAQGKAEQVWHKQALSFRQDFHLEHQCGKQKENIRIQAARAHNLKNIDVTIPANCLFAISGVSGSGKSSLLYDVIYQSARAGRAVNCDSITGLEHFDEVISVNQTEIASSKQSIIATYLDFFDPLRKLFAKTNGKVHPGVFSFNTAEGRCPHCKGSGKVKVSMDFLSDIYESCPECKGGRYNAQALTYQYLGKNIAEVLAMPIPDAKKFFAQEPAIQKPLEMLDKLGIEHLNPGRSLDTLSSGELQRLKLVKYISGKAGGRKLFLLDEPSRGLSAKDIEKLFLLFDYLLQAGHSIIMIEHNRAMLKVAHNRIELGPGGGDEGGQIISKW